MGRDSLRGFVFAAVGLAIPAGIAALGGAGAAFAAEVVVDQQRVGVAAGTEQALVAVTIHDTKHLAKTSVPAGTTVHGAVAVSGREGTPTGTVKVSIYANGACTGSPLADANGNLSNGAIDLTTLTHKPLAPGTISFRGSYGGDATYATALSPCQPLTVTKATPTLTSNVHDAAHAIVTEVYVSETVHLNVVMSGAAGTPTGSVRLDRYAGGTCAGSPLAMPTPTLAGGTAEGSFFQGLAAQSVSYQATYLGDAVYNSRVGPCKVIQFSKAAPTFTLAAHTGAHAVATTVEVGTMLHPSGLLGGPIGTPDGGELRLLTYSGDGVCQGTPVSKAFSYEDGEFHDTSVGVSSSQPAVRGWKLSYSGDGRYLAGTSGCLVLRWKADSSIVVTVHDAQHQQVTSLPAGTFAHNAATASGAFGAPTGLVLIRAYSDGSCGAQFSSHGVNLADGVAHDAIQLYLNKVGAFSFRAHYDGSDAYFPSDSLCVSLTVTKANPTLEVAAHDAGHAAVYSVAPGTPVHPDVTVSGPGQLSTPTGAVEASLFGNAGCTGSSLQDSATIPLAGGAVDLTGFAQVPSSPGTYAFEIRYGGNALYQSGSACSSFVVLAPGATAPPTPSPAPTNAPVATATATQAATVPPTPGAGSSLLPGASTGPAASVVPGASVAPGASGAPGESIGPGESVDPGGSAAPGSSGDPGESIVPGSSGIAPSTVPGATPGQGPDVSPSGDGGGVALPVIVLILLIGALMGGAYWFGRRGRAAA